jgi:RNA polymerase sigma factor (sigma-70 family)
MENRTEDLTTRFERILSQHGAALGRLAATYAADPESQDDLLQEILLAVWTALPGFRGDCSERTFVFRIGHNRGITHRSRRRVHLPMDAAGELPDPRADPERELRASLAQDRLLAAVRQLPAVLRETVSLHLEGLSHTEIAEVLGIRENNVAVRLNRGRSALRAILRPEATP